MGNPKKRAPIAQPDDQSIRLIPLTQGQVATVDADDYDWLSQWNWFAKFDQRAKTFYAERLEKKDGGGQRHVQMHRVILNAPDGMEVDHADRSRTLDNRRSNLRLATKSQSSMNRGGFRNNKSGLKGVYMQHGKWKGLIQKDGKKYYLGSFATKEEASEAYRLAAEQLHGEFACTDPSTHVNTRGI